MNCYFLFSVKKISCRMGAGTAAPNNFYGSFSTTPLTLEFPVIDGKSPCYFKVRQASENAGYLSLNVEEIGGVPDPY